MSTRSFPMMVLPVSKALELEEFPKHEDVKQHLVEWQPSMGNVAFFSHGASTRALDRKRRTAAQHAARGGHAELADRLGGAPVRV